MLFDELEDLYSTHKERLKYLNDFYVLTKVFDNHDYIMTKTIFGKRLELNTGQAIFVKRTHRAIEKYVNSGIYTKERLRDILSIIILNNEIISDNLIEKTNFYVEQGLYKKFLDELHGEIEKVEEERDNFFSDEEWEDILNDL